VLLRCELDAAGAIRELHWIAASRKLAGVRSLFPAPPPGPSSQRSAPLRRVLRSSKQGDRRCPALAACSPSASALITPRLHRIHHSVEHCDRNLGTFLSVWDRLRGALMRDEPGPRAVLGVPGAVETYPQGWLVPLVEAPARALGLRAPRRPMSEAGEVS